MKIQCEKCSIGHELDPPAWVISSGRPFRFRCSSCGHSQMVEAKAPPAATTTATPAPAPAAQGASRNAEPTPDNGKPAETAAESVHQPPPVYLKQEGKVYLVRDWATVQRWIMERRVDREDLVSEGGVRWEPIGSRPELGSFFAAVEQLEAAESGSPAAGPAPFPFAGGLDDPPTMSRFGRLDDDTEGVPVGLPPLPTEEVPGSNAPEPADDYPDIPQVRRGAPESRIEAPEEPVRREPAPPALLSHPEIELGADLAELDAPPPPPIAPVTPARQPEPEPAAHAAPPPAEPVAVPPSEMRTLILDGTPPLPPLPNDDELVSEPDPEPDPAPASSGGAREVAADDPFRDFAPPPQNATQHHDEEFVAKTGPSLGIMAIAGAFALVAIIGIGITVFRATSGEGASHGEAATDEVALGEALPAHGEPPTPEPAPTPPAAATAATAGEGTAEVAPVEAAPTDAAATPPPVAASVATPPPAAPKETPPKETAAKASPPKETTAKASPPKETSEPKPSGGQSVSKLVDKAWDAVDRGSLSSAATTFQSALSQDPNHTDANYGYGYVLLKQGRKDDAKRHLCKALQTAGGDPTVTRDVNGLLSANGLTCS